MAQLALTIGGYAIGGPIGGFIGGTIGGYIDRKVLFPADPIEGPRLEDLKVQISSYGAPIPRLWGTMRMSGNVIWSDDLREVRTVEGGGCGAGPEISTYSYFADFAIGICKGPIADVLRIWADTKLIYSIRVDNAEVVQIDGLKFRFYYGDEEQTSDVTIRTAEDDDVPGFRGLAYIVFNDFPLEQFGNRIPNFSFEVTTVDDPAVPAIDINGPLNNLFFGSDNVFADPDGVHVIIESGGGFFWRVNMITESVVAFRDYRDEDISQTSVDDMDERGRIYTTRFSGGSSAFLQVLDGETFTAGAVTSYVVDAPFHMYVSRNARYPWLYWIDLFGHIGLTHRDIYVYTGETHYDIPPPTGLQFKSVALDHARGVAWAVASDDLHLAGTTKIVRIEPNLHIHLVEENLDEPPQYIVTDVSIRIENADYITYDPDSNQIIVASRFHDTVGSAIAFFDADDLSFITRILGEPSGGPDGAPTGFNIRSIFKQGVVNGFLYLEHGDRFYRLDVVQHRVTKVYIPDDPTGYGGGGVYNALTHSLLQGVLGEPFQKILLDRSDGLGVPLSEIVTDICDDVTLPPSEIAVAELTDTVKGFILNTRTTARAAIQPLMDAYFFDGVESSGLLKFLKRGRASSVTIPDDKLAAHISGSVRPQRMVTTRQQELELPIQIEVSFVDAGFDYETGTQRARRLISRSEEKLALRLPISLTEDEAFQIAQKQLQLIWMSRTTHKIAVGREYSWLDPADVVVVTETGVSHKLRIRDIQNNGGVLVFDVANEDASVYESDASGVPITDRDTPVEYPGPTRFTVMDVPLLLYSNNTPGVYVGTMGILEAWRGANLYLSFDSGATWQLWESSVKDALIGKSTAALGSVSDPFVWDEGNTLNVQLLDVDDVLTSATEEEVLNGANAAVLGEEVIQFRDAELESDGTYTLSGLLRGRMGSDFATNTHVAGEDFVLLTEDRVGFFKYAIERRNVSVVVRAVSFGMRFSSGLDRTYEFEVRNMMPLSPQHIEGERDGSDNLTISWIRRTRIFGDWNDGGDVPLGENSEAYEIDVYDGSEVVRTLTSSTQSKVYTAAEQIADFGSVQAAVDVIIYQMSDIVGRGFPSEQVTI